MDLHSRSGSDSGNFNKNDDSRGAYFHIMNNQDIDDHIKDNDESSLLEDENQQMENV